MPCRTVPHLIEGLTMKVDTSGPLALICYPIIWSAAAERHPHGPGYDWRAHFRDLVAAARKAHEEQPLALRLAGGTERWFISKLAAMTPSEIEVAIMMVDAKQRPDPLAFVSGCERKSPNGDRSLQRRLDFRMLAPEIGAEAVD
jgi:hypothetical protein